MSFRLDHRTIDCQHTHPLTMAVLNDLPYETLVELLSFLSSADLASTTRVSRCFYDVSQPLLYTTPCLAKTPTTHPTVAGSSLGILLRTLLTPGREALGSHVRTLSLELDDTAPVTEYTDDSMARITAIASKLRIVNPLATQGSHLMILLDLLPRLHALQISPPNVRFFETTATLPCGLRSLRKIHYIRTARINYVKLKRILTSMKLPSIRSISVPNINGRCLSIERMDAVAATSPITHLRYSNAELYSGVRYNCARALHYILQVPIALTHFSYTAVMDGSLVLPVFMRTLLCLRLSLQSLHLDFCGEANYAEEEMDFLLPYPEGSLREWPVLRTLSCSLVPLLGRGQPDCSARLMDVLPPSLRELEILRDWKWEVAEAVKQVVEMLAQKECAVPRLEKVAVVMSCVDSQYAVDELTVACEAAGVSFVGESFRW